MKNTKSMKQIPQEMRPYERCLKDGPGILSDAELLAVILRTGSIGETSIDLAVRLLSLSHCRQGIWDVLEWSVPELIQIKGIGTVKAVQLQCIGELSRRIAKAGAKEAMIMQEPSTIADYYMEDMRHCRQEILRMMMLNTKNRLIGECIITKGTVNASLISAREIFLEALKYQAVCIILVHNHPSGDPTPSKEDILVTRRIRDAGELIGISVLDHLIIGDHSYISLKERGII